MKKKKAMKNNQNQTRINRIDPCTIDLYATGFILYYSIIT